MTYDIAGTAVVKNANVEFNVNAHTCVDQEDVRMENNSAMISIPVVPLAGDINFDGQVSFDDFLILSANFGKDFVASPADGDLNDDKLVNFADFLILSVNFAPKSEQIESRPDEASVDVVLATLDAGDPGQLEKLGGEGLGLVFGRQRPKLAESMK